MNRQQFMDMVLELLKSEGFTMIQDNQWKFEETVVRPAPRVVVNGQVMQAQPTEVNVEFIVDLIGEGYCQSDISTDYFEQIGFRVNEGGNVMYDEEICIFYDWFYEFEQLIGSIKSQIR